MCFYHTFDAVGDQFPRSQTVVHTVVPHGKTVADGNGVEFQRCATGGQNAVFDGAGHLRQMPVPRHDLVETVDDPHQRAGHLFTGLAQRTQQSTLGGG